MKISIHRNKLQFVLHTRASNGGRSLCVQISTEWSYPLPIYLYHSKGNWLRYSYAANSFYIMKLCSRLFVLYCRNCPKDDKFRYLIPHYEEVRGSIEPWLMACWKAHVDFLLSIIKLLFLSLTTEALPGKTCQNSLLLERVGQFEPRFQGEGSSLGNIFWFLQK